MDIIKTTNPLEFESYANDCLSGHEGMVLHVAASVNAWTGQLDTLDRAECERRGIVIGTGLYLGGSIVNMPGDLSVCLTTWGESDFAPRAVDAIADWLASRGVAITRDGNDVLADGKKVISWARAMHIRGWCQSVIHFSVGPMDLDLVKAICTKPMAKIPGALSDYGVTAEMIWDEIERRRLL